jgi:hypothetical protein
MEQINDLVYQENNNNHKELLLPASKGKAKVVRPQRPTRIIARNIINELAP